MLQQQQQQQQQRRKALEGQGDGSKGADQQGAAAAASSLQVASISYLAGQMALDDEHLLQLLGLLVKLAVWCFSARQQRQGHAAAVDPPRRQQR